MKVLTKDGLIKMVVSFLAHAASHLAGGSDPIKLDDMGAPDDNTDLNASAVKHGLCPKLDGAAAHALLGDGSLGHPEGIAHHASHESGGGDAIKLDDLAAPDDNTDLNVGITGHGLCPKAPNDTTKFLRGDATYAIPVPISAYNDITADMTWDDTEQTLDLTAKTAASATWVILSCYINRVGDYVGSLIWRRYSDSVELARVTMVHTGGTDEGGVCILPMDSEQRLKYVAPSGTTTKYVKILGYW